MSHFEEEDPEIKEVSDVAVVTVLGKKLLTRLSVIPEGYDKRTFGRVKRAYLEQFDLADRQVLSRWYPRIYGWFYRTGIPVKGVRMSLKTYQTLCRFADFFASV